MSSCCHCAAPDASARAATKARPPAWGRLAFAGFVAGQSMIFGLAVNLSPPTGLTRTALHAALAAAAILVFALIGLPLWRAALAGAARGRIVFEQLFLAGILGAFAASLVSTFTGVGHVYYEVVAILLAIYTFGRTLGDRRREAALEAARALGAEFETCERVGPDGALSRIPGREIRRGDLVQIAAGGGVPIDGLVVEGSALVRESTLTGEAFPVTRRPGDPVLAGSQLLDGPLRVRATAAGDERLLDALFDRVRAAQSRPAHLQREADRLVAWFLPGVMLIAALTFAVWTVRAGWTTGLFNALAVLLVACPCSMGLATPIGVWSALADLTGCGVVAGTSDLIERLAQVEQIIFDKTGTLGDERLALVDFVCAPSLDRAALLGEISALEAASGHPIANAFRTYAPAGVVEDIRPLSGIGIEGHVSGVWLRIGNASLLGTTSADSLRAQLHPTNDTATREIYVLRDGALAGIAILREQLRDSARAVLAELEAAGLPCTVLTGDASPAAHGFAAVESGLTPLEKAPRVRELSAAGRVLFVGDGVNDAPAMAEAHASLALASGSPLARETSLGELHDLRAIPFALARSRAAVRAIRQNLLFAAAYNVVGITLAATGILHPIAAALLMLASSLTVSVRALRPVNVRLTPRPRPAPLAGVPHPQPI